MRIQAILSLMYIMNLMIKLFLSFNLTFQSIPQHFYSVRFIYLSVRFHFLEN